MMLRATLALPRPDARCARGHGGVPTSQAALLEGTARHGRGQSGGKVRVMVVGGSSTWGEEGTDWAEAFGAASSAALLLLRAPVRRRAAVLGNSSVRMLRADAWHR